MTAPLHITIAVCTWNRCELLAKTLEQMTQLVIPPAVTWELVVVNNRSTDATDAVIASFEGRLPVRRLFEDQPGLSNARNRALAEATGEFILWTDDDILVEENWLAEYVAAFRRWPEAIVFGGPIDPLFEGRPPDWIPPVLDWIGSVFGRQTLGSEPVPLSIERVGEGPYGGNMAMRCDVLRSYRFNPNFGVRHGQYSISEETEVIRKILIAGYTGWWTPEPRVTHWVPRASQTLSYVRRWMVGSGRYLGQVPERDPLSRVSLLGLWRRFLRYELQFRIRRLITPPEVWIRDLMRSGRTWGRILERRDGRSGSSK